MYLRLGAPIWVLIEDGMSGLYPRTNNYSGLYFYLLLLVSTQIDDTDTSGYRLALASIHAAYIKYERAI
jgi:hypothetical protein